MGDDAAKFWCGSLVECGKANERALASIYLIDFVCRKSRVDLQFVRFGNNDHDDLGGPYDAADRVDGELMNDPCRWCAKIDVIQLISCGHHPFGQFSLLVLGLTKVLHDVGAEILI